MTITVTATEFTRNFAPYQRTVQHESIEMRSHEKVTGYFLSPEDYERVVQILAASRRPHHPTELLEHLKVAIKNTGQGEHHGNQLFKNATRRRG